MNECQHYRLLRQEQTSLREKKFNAEQNLLIYAKHPDLVAPDQVEESRQQERGVTARLLLVTEEMCALEKVPSVRSMLLRELGMSDPKGNGAAVYTSYGEIEEKEIPWLWEPFLPIGTFTILEGDPGQGKSWFSLAIATCVTLGQWLDLTHEGASSTAPASVLHLTCEDDPAYTIKKRLRILQADTTRVFHIAGKRKAGQSQICNITLGDIPLLSEAIDHTQAKLLIVDPIQGYLPPGIEMNKAEQVRPMTMALQRLATEKQIAILLLRHFNKSQQEKGIYKGVGSIDFFAGARSVLVASERKELEEWTTPMDGSPPKLMRRRFAVAQQKLSIGLEKPTIEFELQKDSFFWVGPSCLTAEELLAPPETRKMKIVTLQEAKRFLLTTLQEGAMEITELKKRAKKTGIDMQILNAAKAELRLETRSDESGWSWFLPGQYVAH